MARTELPSGVTVETPSAVEVEQVQRGAPDLPTGPITIDPGDDDLRRMVGDAGFDVVDRVVLSPTLEPTAPTGVRRRSAPEVPGEQAVTLSLDTVPGTDAVVLVEQGGVYSWVLPDNTAAGPAATRSAGGTRSFRIELQPQPGEPTATRGFVSDFIYEKATALVLRYVAAPAGRAAVAHFEQVDEGIVVMTPEGPWRHVEPDELSIPDGGRVLLFVHGTFSSTENSFGPLLATDEGRRFLADANQAYDLVIGVDHRTLSLDPIENAANIVELVRAIPGAEGVTVDALGYSRGGLVLRSIIEVVAPEQGWDVRFRRAVFVGVVHNGTLLASPEHWHRLVDLYTNLVMAGASGVGALLPGAAAPAALAAGALKLIGAAVKVLASELIDESAIPGLAAMLPGGDFVTRLNGPNPEQPSPDRLEYFAITSNFQTDETTLTLPSRLKFMLKDGLMDRLMGEDNDLVVNTSSMTAIEPGYLRDRFDFGTNGTVFHTNYFQQPDVARALTMWWDLLPEMAAPAPMDPAPPPPAPTAVASPPPPEARRRRSAAPPPPAADLAAPAAPADDTTTEMSFSAGMDDPVPVGEVATIEVGIGTDTVGGAAAASGTGEVDMGQELVVQVMCRSGFKPAGPTRVTVPATTTDPLYFDVEATDPGDGQVDVVVRQGVVPIITLSLRPTVVVAGAAPPAQRAAASGTAAPAPPLTRPLHQLRITERMSDGKIVYDYDFESEELGVLVAGTSEPLQTERAAFVERLFKEIEDRWIGGGQDAANFRQDLRAYGASLFEELVPREIQGVLWEHRDEIDAVQVISTEPFIPWEIVHLKEPGGALGADEHFLGSKGLVRWLHGTWPPDTLRVRPDRVRAVIPRYPAGTNYELPEAEAELGFLQAQFGAQEVEPSVAAVRSLLSEADGFDLLHFAGHGLADPDDVANARIMMQGRVEGSQYIPEYLNATTVRQFANLEESRPLVMLNACQVGRAGYQLTSIGGFAAAFLSRGAGGFVSSLWSVGDRPARTFTERFYERMLDGDTVTEAVRDARRAAADAGDATWLAYTVYAHPHARLVPG